jgi:S1-C subfamily serine protease
MQAALEELNGGLQRLYGGQLAHRPRGHTRGVVAGGPAATAGIQEGDIITAIGDTKIDREHPLDAVLSGYAPGQTVTVKLLRDGQERTVNVTLGTRPSGL